MESFEAALERAAQEFLKVKGLCTIKLVSNLDADGLSAAAIMMSMLRLQGLKCSVSILHQLTEKEARQLSRENADLYIFCDLGSGQLKALSKHLKDRKVFVLDHHEPQGEAGHIVQVNPHLHCIDGSSQVSAAGVCLLFASKVDERMESLSHLAVIGAIGDAQERNGFQGPNERILKMAIENGRIRVEKSIRLYGLETRPLVKLLTHSADLDIPGISGDEQGSSRLLSELGIEQLDKNANLRTFYDLKEEERERLLEAIVMKRRDASIDRADKIRANSYILPDEDRGPFRDAKEFSTVLNACGRMEKPMVGIGACMGELEQKQRALAVLDEYKKALVGAMSWFERQSRTGRQVMRGEGYIIINGKKSIRSTIIGTITSMLTKGRMVDKGTFVLGLARNKDRTTKASLRIAGRLEGVDLGRIMIESARAVGGEGGGHRFAGGAFFPTRNEQRFIEKAIREIENITTR